MSVISIRMDKKEKAMIEKMAKFNHVGISTYIKKAIFEKLEDEYDLIEYDQAITEFKKNPVTFSMEQVLKELEGNEL